jgi:hypothetical protein
MPNSSFDIDSEQVPKAHGRKNVEQAQVDEDFYDIRHQEWRRETNCDENRPGKIDYYQVDPFEA